MKPNATRAPIDAGQVAALLLRDGTVLPVGKASAGAPGPTPSPSQESTRPQRAVMSVEEFAGWAGLGRSTVYELVRPSKVPHRRVGSRILIPVEKARAWLEGDE